MIRDSHDIHDFIIQHILNNVNYNYLTIHDLIWKRKKEGKAHRHSLYRYFVTGNFRLVQNGPKMLMAVPFVLRQKFLQEQTLRWEFFQKISFITFMVYNVKQVMKLT